jgi:hypothetical protein
MFLLRICHAEKLSRAAATDPSASSTPSSKTKGKTKQDDYDDELERLLLADNDNRDAKLGTSTSQRVEEEEGEEIDVPLRSQIPKKRPSPSTDTTIPASKPKSNTYTSQLPPTSSILAKSSATPSSKNDIPPQASSSTLKPPKLKAAAKPAKKTKIAPPKVAETTSYVDEEIIEIERPTKKPRISMANTPRQPQAIEPPKPKSPVQLSLPGGPSTFVAPPVPPSIPSKKAANINTSMIPVIVPPGVSANLTMEEVLGDEEEEEEEEEWEAVPTPAPAVQAPPSQHEYDALENEIFGQDFGEDEEQELDFNAFEAELNEQMGMEDDGDDGDDMEDVMQEVASASTNRPISLNRFASGMVEGESEDEYSSSDSESD